MQALFTLVVISILSSLSKSLVQDPTAALYEGRHLPGLIEDSEEWCRTQLPDVPRAARMYCATMPRSSVLISTQGVQLGVRSCIHTHQEKRAAWQCELSPDRRTYWDGLDVMSVFSQPLMASSTHERARVEAFIGAASAVLIAKGCTTGELLSECWCGDDEHLTEKERQEMEDSADSQIRPCHHNYKVGYTISSGFFGNLMKALSRRDERFVLSRHNVEVGVQVASEAHAVKCQCVGQSGSCTIKTCYSETKDMTFIGHKIAAHYRRGERVRIEDGKLFKKSSGEKIRIGRSPDLVHLDDSHDYCRPNPITPGIRGRECPAERSAPECDQMCCMPDNLTDYQPGSRFELVNVTEAYDCNCEFEYCCTVRCQVCKRHVPKKLCKAPAAP